jgi:hypothetical protein
MDWTVLLRLLERWRLRSSWNKVRGYQLMPWLQPLTLLLQRSPPRRETSSQNEIKR